MDYNRYFSDFAKCLRPNPLLEIGRRIQRRCTDNAISLFCGLPNPSLFPIREVSLKLQDNTEVELNQQDMKLVQQYSSEIYGYRPLHQWCQNMIKDVHNPPTLEKPKSLGGLQLMLSNGCNEGLRAVVTTLVNVGDGVVVDEAIYPQMLVLLRMSGAKLLPVAGDSEGMDAGALRKRLSEITSGRNTHGQIGMPKLMCFSPTGGNPTGITMSLKRKHELYAVAKEYDLLIMEDDPYFFLQFHQPLVPSFLSIDTDGRVIRLDSFSKVIAGGLRVGIISGAFPIIEKVCVASEMNYLQNNMGQMVVFKLVSQWGLDGFMQNVGKIREFYKNQQEAMEKAAQVHLFDLTEWIVPNAGMFYWLKLKTIKDTKKLIEERAFKKEVILSPGCIFTVDEDSPSPYVRACFAIATPEQMDEGFRRLAELIKEEMDESK